MEHSEKQQQDDHGNGGPKRVKGTRCSRAEWLDERYASSTVNL